MRKAIKSRRFMILLAALVALSVVAFSWSSLPGISEEVELSGPLFEESLEPHPVD